MKLWLYKTSINVCVCILRMCEYMHVSVCIHAYGGICMCIFVCVHVYVFPSSVH